MPRRSRKRPPVFCPRSSQEGALPTSLVTGHETQDIDENLLVNTPHHQFGFLFHFLFFFPKIQSLLSTAQEDKKKKKRVLAPKEREVGVILGWSPVLGSQMRRHTHTQVTGLLLRHRVGAGRLFPVWLPSPTVSRTSAAEEVGQKEQVVQGCGSAAECEVLPGDAHCEALGGHDGGFLRTGCFPYWYWWALQKDKPHVRFQPRCER